MSRCRQSICGAVAAFALFATPALAIPPNIVLILADDLGGSFGGQGVPTPNIDAIADGGAVFTNGYASPLCVPSRAKLLTGRYEQAMGIYGNPTTEVAEASYGLPATQRTIADDLRAIGYATGIFGKWHLGHLPQYRPLARGFDEGHYVLLSDEPYLPPNDPLNPFYQNELTVSEDRYSTAAFGAEAAAFVDRNADRPFFLYAPFTAVHTPLQATPELLARVPDSIPAKRRVFAAVLIGLDDAVGAILEAIRGHGLEQNTIVVFLGDNGCRTTYGCLTGGLRASKGSNYEGGVRVPFAIAWPGVIPAQKFAAPVMSMDLRPTLVTAAGGPLPPKIDGVNLLPFLQGLPGEPHQCLAWGLKKSGAIRCGNWKMISGQLYDLSTDPGEKLNVAAANPATLADLRAKRTALTKPWKTALW